MNTTKEAVKEAILGLVCMPEFWTPFLPVSMS